MKKAIVIICMLLVIFAGCKTNTTAVTEDTGNTTPVVEEKKTEPVAPAVNIVWNPGFEDGVEGWFPFGSCKIDVVQDQVHSGANAAIASNRGAGWQGIGINLTQAVEADVEYAASAWVTLKPGVSAQVNMTYKKADGDGDKYNQICSLAVTGGEWVELSGSLKFAVSGELKELVLYFEGPDAGVDIIVDDVVLVKK